MSEILLSSKKQSRFEELIERAIFDEFDEPVDVSVKSNGKIYIREEQSSYQSANCVVDKPDELYSLLSDLNFEYKKSTYVLDDGSEDPNLSGATFYLQRDGW